MSTTPPVPPQPPPDAEERTSDHPDAPKGTPSTPAYRQPPANVGSAVLARYLDWGLKLFSLAVIPLFVWIWQHDRSDVATLQRLDTIERDMAQIKSDTKERLAKLGEGVESCEDRQVGIAVLENELGHLQEGIHEIKVRLSTLHGSTP